ncbi:MAG: DUF1638 domain-containing protein [Desulfurivibrionaceae bacterium]|nr:DUF1638 domain-containing protein [Desulfurivibrionaceae bacterium]
MAAARMHNKKPATLVACGIFADELQAVLAEKGLAPEIVWLPAALHTDLDQLQSELDSVLAAVTKRRRRPCVLYGSSCLPAAQELFQRHGARGFAACNCIEALVGREERQRYEAEGCFLMTPGWVRSWPAMMASLGWDGVDVRTNLGRYAKILVFDAGVHPLTDEEVVAFFDLTGLFVETVALRLDHFEALITRLLDQGGS